MGWIFAAEMHGQGIASEACARGAGLGGRRIWRRLLSAAIIVPDNEPSIKLAETARVSSGRRDATYRGRGDRCFQAPPGADQKRSKPGNRAAHDERMDVVRSFIGVHGLQVRGVAHDLEFGRDAVAAMHVAGDARDFQRLAAIVALDRG